MLIVEDDYLLANDLARGFGKAGIEIAGPVPSLAGATELIESGHIDMGVLDIKLDTETIYPVADALIGRGVPIVFVTGYDADAIPARYADVPRCEKPASVEQVIEALGRALSA